MQSESRRSAMLTTADGREVEIRPGEMWPDGKVRPHSVKTKDGNMVWLTDEEFDRMRTEAGHKFFANEQGPSSAPRPKVKVGELVTPILPDQVDGWPDFTVRKIKTDGRVILESLHDDLGELDRAKAVKIGEQDFLVLRASGRSVTLRLLREGEVVDGPWLPPQPPAPAASSPAKSPTIGEVVAQALAPHNRQAREERKARRLKGLAQAREWNRQKGLTDKLVADIKRGKHSPGTIGGALQ